MNLVIERYSSEKKTRWDKFVLDESINGTFLQTRKFIEYHSKGKYEDCSLMIFNGNTLVSVILACEIMTGEGKDFFSHKGTTYGGLVVSPDIYNATSMDLLISCLEKYLRECGYSNCCFKMTPRIFCKKDTELIDYFMYQKGFRQYSELNYYMDLERYKGEICSQFSSGKRRDYKYSLKYSLDFKRLVSKEEVKAFYEVLVSNLARKGLKCVHSFDELLDLKWNRFDDKIEFYGVFKEGRLIAGSMVFLFDSRVFHTQYLASDNEYLECYPMEFLIYNLINEAVNKRIKYFCFGICTEDRGTYLNLGLSRFKEGFGAEFCINKTYEKKLID